VTNKVIIGELCKLVTQVVAEVEEVWGNSNEKTMKKLVLVAIMPMLFAAANAQEIKHADLATTTTKGEFTSYVGSDGGVYKVGDRIKIGVPSSNKTFAYIMMGDGILTPLEPLPAAQSGTETEIKKIFVVGNKRTGYSVSMRTKGVIGLLNYTVQFENALSTGEIKGSGMTSDEALEALKKAKDKLDLGLITQEEYDKIKVELTPFIK
jgi:hypothetical protein